MTDDQWLAKWNRWLAASDRVKERYARFVAFVMSSQPLPF